MKSSFNPWPLGVLLAFILFGAGTAGMVVLACSQRSDLVRADYYDQEIRHQEHLDRREKTLRLAPETRVTYDRNRRNLTLSLPETQGRHCVGQIQLYRPSTAALDRHVPLELDDQGRQRIDAGDLQPGLWRIQLTWLVDHDEFYFEQRFVVEHAH